MSVDLNVTSTAPAVIEVTAVDKMKQDDYEQFQPAVEALIKEHGKIRVLLQLVDFKGWSAGALWEDLKFDFKHFDDIERLAIVGEKQWEKGMASFCRPFTTAEVRFFEPNELEEARSWVHNGGSEAAGRSASGQSSQQ